MMVDSLGEALYFLHEREAKSTLAIKKYQ